MPSMSDLVERHFGLIGARARVAPPGRSGRVALDVRDDRRGEYFDLRLPETASLAILNEQPADRHLLLLVVLGGEKSRFLCGHDERLWFVAAIPESARGVTTVAKAKQALQPAEVRQLARRLRRAQRGCRRNPAFIRQGEWFFVLATWLQRTPGMVLRHEPLSRGRGKPHRMEFAYRRGGTTVYVSRNHPGGISQAEYNALSEDVRRGQSWRQMVRDADVFASGRVTHPDHATVTLNGWHQVFLNTEAGARAMRHVAFLD